MIPLQYFLRELLFLDSRAIARRGQPLFRWSILVAGSKRKSVVAKTAKINTLSPGAINPLLSQLCRDCYIRDFRGEELGQYRVFFIPYGRDVYAYG